MSDTDSTVVEPTVAIIGAGFAGVCLGIKLSRAGIPFVVLEKASAVGGVWRDNVYPGAACDVPSHLYSYSFEPSHDWSRAFGQAGEIRSYIETCARKYGVLDHVRYDSEVTAASFDEHRGRWRVTVADGTEVESRFLVPATGQLSLPAEPSVPGLDSFEGTAFHSARWDHDVDLTRKRIAVIGSGASAIQFVPQIVGEVDRLSLFQRSAPYVLPKPDRPYSPLEKYVYRNFPATLATSRTRKYLYYEARVIPMTKGRGLRLIRGLFRRHLRKHVPDPQLRRRLTPTYPLGCKRVLISNDWYPAITRPNVEVLSTGLAEVRPHAVVGADGSERKVDVIIFGTGFAASDLLAPMAITGLDGVNLRRDAWRDGPEAYLGMTVTGFPNMFILYGPNTNLGHNSIIYMLESQTDYVLSAIRHLGVHGHGWANVRPEVQARYNEEIQRLLSGTVWESGCTSWYRSANGKNTSNWPGFTTDYRKRTRFFDAGNYEVRPAVEPTASSSRR
ncbi:flavin-binding monooxygenase [Actinomycetospora sp. NBRC 106375]|uniref:flavin-containing monooxygenase n=1 Tax=Actinomycetospora sp. NBRC 106375 TaxID=3032207 RepID=UPI0024A0D65C|nr:NAD(P)/FAD-dependent oxidoreductase [Actinomycetospora sp. NBRC 106375]GLZ49162.1 flavin-binding monooxygenase [Actinomycetospora sp. NBRC 106375]